MLLFVFVPAASAQLYDVSSSINASVPRIGPGGTIRYNIAWKNDRGNINASGARLTLGFTGEATCTWRCLGGDYYVYTPSYQHLQLSCPSPASGSGSLSHRPYLPAYSTYFYSAECTVSPTAVGSIVAVAGAYEHYDMDTGNDVSAVTTPLMIWNDVAVTTTNGVAIAQPGGFVVHDVVVSNKGTVTASDIRVVADFPASETCTWQCSGDGCPITQGQGNLDHLTSVPAYSRQIYTASCDIAADATGTLTSTASVAFLAGVTDMATQDNTASDTTSLTPVVASLSIGPDSSLPNKPSFITSPERVNVVTWEVRNDNAITAVSAQVTLDIPPALVNARWHCDVPGAARRCAVRVVGSQWIVQFSLDGVHHDILQLQTGVANGPWESIELHPVISVLNGTNTNTNSNASPLVAPVSLFRGDFERPSLAF